ncbi:MAG: tetratricopeptide repeat protein [Bacteroidetes bacterium]|nr:tetratricopeptide repeat protein [Bacteroidota bacterium]
MFQRFWVLVLLLLLFSGLHASMPDSLRVQLAGLADSAQVKLLIGKSSAVMYSDPAKAKYYLKIAFEVAEKPENKAILPKAVNQRGTLAWIEGDYKAALADYQLAEKLFQEAGNPLGAAKAQNNIGLVYRDMSYYDLSMEALLKAAAYFEVNKDPYALATIYTNIGNVCNGNNDQVQTEKYYGRALTYFTELQDTNGLSMIHNNLGLTKKGGPADRAAAKAHFEAALAGYEAIGQVPGQASVLGNLGALYILEGQFEIAESLTLRSLQLADSVPSASEQTIAHLKLAELYLKWGRPELAIQHAQTSLEIGATSMALLPAASAHEVLAVAYKQMGNYEQAYVHLEMQSSLSDSIFNEGKTRAIEEMRLKFDIQLKDQALETMAQKQRVDQLSKIGLAVVIVLLLIFGYVIYTRQRAVFRREQALQQKDKEMHATQKELAEAELKAAAADLKAKESDLKAAAADLKAKDSDLKAAESEQKRLQEEISFKGREITSLAMNIVRRNDLLEVLDRELKSLRKGADEQKLKELSILVSQTLSLENERKEFQLYIQEAQQNFFMRLDAEFPDLSPKEKRLCAMIKLGLSSKEIAAVFNIEGSSVEVARHRLRKKLNLEPSASLKEFLEGF